MIPKFVEIKKRTRIDGRINRRAGINLLHHQKRELRAKMTY